MGQLIKMPKTKKKGGKTHKIIGTGFNQKEMVIIESMIGFLDRNDVLDKPTYYSFLKLAAYRLVQELALSLFEPEQIPIILDIFNTAPKNA